MNLLHVISEIEKEDADVFDRMNTRRAAMKQFSTMGKKIALASIPFALGSMFNKAYGQSSSNAVLFDVLNYALTLEYLESEFYATGAAAVGLVPAGESAMAIQTIRDHEAAHVIFLKSAITAAGGTPVSKPQFDFTASGAFSDVFTNYATFLAVAQTFEDTGVRAYKGRAAEVVMGGDYLTAALNIHSVEARHASHIRQMRRSSGQAPSIKPWITGKDSGIGSAVQASYNGEENTTQAGVNIVNINGMNITADAASEAFDEPLSKDQVLAIVAPFIK